MKMFLCMGGPSEGSNAGTHAVANAMKLYLGLAHGGTGNQESKTIGSPGHTGHAIETNMSKIYLAGSNGDEAGMRKGCPITLRILLSYHYYQNEDIADLLDNCFGGTGIDVFADSGAFSAFTVGKTIDVDAYIAWVNKWKHRFTAVSAPDIIGDPGATQRETDKMLKQVSGVPVLPVFHVGEDWSFLQAMCSRPEIDYIALGGMVPYTRKQKLLSAWISKAFSIIPERVRVHGFGLTTWSMLLKHPFYSVDSSSWTVGFRYAQLWLFDDKSGQFTTVAMGQRKSLLENAKLLESYGIRPTEVQASGYDRDRLVAVAVESWQRAEKWLTAYKTARGLR